MADEYLRFDSLRYEENSRAMQTHDFRKGTQRKRKIDNMRRDNERLLELSRRLERAVEGFSQEDRTTLLDPQKSFLDSFKYVRDLGEGGYGFVYEVISPKGRHYAVKEGEFESLIQEYSISRQIDHPNCLKMRQFLLKGVDDPTAYILSDVLPGILAKNYINKLSLAEVVIYKAQLNDVLHYFRENNIVPDDLGLHNMNIDRKNKKLYVFDYGHYEKGRFSVEQILDYLSDLDLLIQ
jgi:serine/threonine protein kinase